MEPSFENESAALPPQEPTTTKGVSKKRQRVAKQRAPARPYRRLPQETLDSRVSDMKGRASLLRSKLVLLDNRLLQHEREQEHRAVAAHGGSNGSAPAVGTGQSPI